MIDLLENIYILHSYKIAHRDIKPENIMFFKDQNKWLLIDYSESEIYIKKNLTTSLKGTPIYWTPHL
jgi:serine/threonine protein kinase